MARRKSRGSRRPVLEQTSRDPEENTTRLKMWPLDVEERLLGAPGAGRRRRGPAPLGQGLLGKSR